MVPNFALSLSFEGIALLRHVDGVWARIDDVRLDADDLAVSVPALLDRAVTLDPDGAQVALVIPNEQIRYLDCPDLGGDETARETAIHATLDGATPYAVNELAFDYTNSAGRLQIAAVAQETLSEAEGFARQYGFEPVCYIAKAPDGAFDSAVFFGAAPSWTGDTPERPAQPMQIVAPSDRALTPVVVAQPEPAPEPEHDAVAEPLAEPDAPRPEPEIAANSAQSLPDEQTPTVPSEPDIQATPVIDDIPEPAPAAPAPKMRLLAKKPKQPVAAQPALENAEPKAPIAPTFSSRRAAPDLPSDLPAPTAAATAPTTPTAPAPKAPDVSKDTPLTGVAARITPTPPADAAIKDSGVTSGKIDGDEKTGLSAGAAAALRFLSSRRKKQVEDAQTASAQPETKPVAPAVNRIEPKAIDAPAPPRTAVPPAPRALPLGAAKSVPAPVAKAPAAPTITPDDVPPGVDVAAQASPQARAPARGKIALPKLPSLKKAAPAAAPAAVAAPAVPADPKPKQRGFLKRKTPEPASTPKIDEERERMTVFGARGQNKPRVGGKPRFLGLLLTFALMLFLVGVAAWASLFQSEGFAGLFGTSDEETVALSTPSGEVAPVLPAPESNSSESDPQPNTNVQVAALETTTDETEPDTPVLSEPIQPQPLSPEEAAATYAATGIWQRTPTKPHDVTEDSVDDVYVASVDPKVQESDATALPSQSRVQPEPGIADPGLPPPADMRFDFDDRGLVRATPEGALTPDGLRIYTGPPPAVPPQRTTAVTPPAAGAETQAPTTTPQSNDGLRALRPRLRPSNLTEANERASLAGSTRAELAAFRPVMRPKTPQEEAQEEEPEATATRQAVAASLAPVTRPRNMEAIVRRAEREQASAPVRTAAVAPRTVAPTGPSAASVSRAATVRNAINLNKVSLIGVFGTPSQRRALVRLPNGRYQKVKVGDRLDGGRVQTINDDELRYTKSGRSVRLKMPRS